MLVLYCNKTTSTEATTRMRLENGISQHGNAMDVCRKSPHAQYARISHQKLIELQQWDS